MQTEPENEELVKLLRNAGIFMRRGDLEAAEKSCREAIDVSSDSAEAHELLGDLLAARGQTQSAAESYHHAMQLDPKRASAEMKYARLVLNLSQSASEEEALKAGLSPSDAPKAQPHNATLSCLASMLWPGLGQWYNGENTKAIILAAVYGVATLFLLATGDMGRLLSMFVTVMAPMSHTQSAQQGPGVLSALLWGGWFMSWLYAVIDAPIRASKKSKPVNDYTEPGL